MDMGKRGRRRTRDSTASTDPAASQQIARVNVEDEYWKQFRMEAIRTNRSVASYLGALVRREVVRVKGRSSPLDEASGPSS
jgi:hypothetical protein